MDANRINDKGHVISVEDSDVPPWQRQVVWTEDEMGLLAYSIIKGFPIGMIILRRDGKRIFSVEQKIAIWERANKKCQHPGCKEQFPNFRDADADHIVMWLKNGETSVENGRLLCKNHNRSRR